MQANTISAPLVHWSLTMSHTCTNRPEPGLNFALYCTSSNTFEAHLDLIKSMSVFFDVEFRVWGAEEMCRRSRKNCKWLIIKLFGGSGYRVNSLVYAVSMLSYFIEDA